MIGGRDVAKRELDFQKLRLVETEKCKVFLGLEPSATRLWP